MEDCSYPSLAPASQEAFCNVPIPEFVGPMAPTALHTNLATPLQKNAEGTADCPRQNQLPCTPPEDNAVPNNPNPAMEST